MWSARAPASVISPPATPSAARKVAASMRSGITVCSTGDSCSTPSMVMVELPAPSTWAPMRLRNAARSAISGSRAALSITVVPLASTDGHQRVLGGADARELEQDAGADELVGRGLDVAVGRLEHGAELLEPLEVHVDRAGPEVVAARAAPPGPGRSGPAAVRAPRSTPASARRARRAPRARSPRDGRSSSSWRRGAGDGHPHRGEQVAHARHVGDVGHVAQHVGALGQAGRGHQLEHRVLGAADGDLARQRPAGAHDDPIGRPGHLHGAQYAPPTPSGEVDRIGSTVVANFVTTHVVTTDRLADFLAPRTDLLIERLDPADGQSARIHSGAAERLARDGQVGFTVAQGPFTRYERTVRVAPAGSEADTGPGRGHPGVRLRAGRPGVGVPVRRSRARRRCGAPNRAVRPWWLPPDQLTRRRRGDAVAALRVRRAGRLPRHAADPDQHLLQGGVRRHRRARSA